MPLFSAINWKPDELNAIAAIASAVAAMVALFVAALTAYYQRKSLQHAWESTSASMVTKFVDDWQTRHYRDCRKRFATQLLKVREIKAKDPQAEDFIKEIGIVDVPVLGFFENVAYLTRRGVLDQGMVWNKFFWELERYYIAITQPAKLIQEWRRGDQTTVYAELEWLYRNLLPYDRAQRKLAVDQGGPTASDMETFLKEESKLEILSS
ncbi:MAG: hypothetical protein IAG10_16675 [Planctomycetaceae bacterium]|nr:hypothetical protein [Planctomycetaceae bacterium]